MEEDKEREIDDAVKEPMSVAPADPDERAFTGHPDHPPQQPDQTLESNQELLDDGAEADAPATGA